MNSSSFPLGPKDTDGTVCRPHQFQRRLDDLAQRSGKFQVLDCEPVGLQQST